MTEKIYLRFETDPEGNARIVDQHGRQLAGVESFEASYGLDEADKLTVRVVQLYGERGAPRLGGRSSEGKGVA